MKKLIVILTVGFLLTFSATSQARGFYGRGCGRGYYGHGYAHGGYYGRGYYGHGYWGPHFGVAVRPYCSPIWYAPHWGLVYGRRVWMRGYWR
jgi:hypothetical protein